MRIVLGIGGGIAAYKAAELTRALQRRGHRVQAVLPDAAQKFITPLTFAALTGEKVITDLFASNGGAAETLSSAVEHIGVAQQNDLLLVAPATAGILGKFAHGFADDFLSTLYLAFTGPVVIAPAMNDNMWLHPATQANVATLRDRGHFFVNPEEGWLACGSIALGRLAEPETIAEATDLFGQSRHDLDGDVVLITAGPTQEPVDPVRYITNRSSGKMGYALAAAARARGAEVILISGPVQIPAPYDVTVVKVRTAVEMRNAVMEHLERASIIIKAAAVADYYIADIPQQKLKKTAARLSLELDPTPDILAEIGKKKGHRILIGFAAETGRLVEEARRKLDTKNCDLVVGNLVNQEGSGFDSDSNEVVLVANKRESIPIGPGPKTEIAERILDQIPALRLAAEASDSVSQSKTGTMV